MIKYVAFHFKFIFHLIICFASQNKISNMNLLTNNIVSQVLYTEKADGSFAETIFSLLKETHLNETPFIFPLFHLVIVCCEMDLLGLKLSFQNFG